MVMMVGNCLVPPQWYILNPLAWASWALITESRPFFCKKPFESSYPKKYEQPLVSFFFTVLSNLPVSLSTGSAHIKSQKEPLLGISLKRSIFLMSSIFSYEIRYVFNVWRNSTVDAEELVVNQGGQGQSVKKVHDEIVDRLVILEKTCVNQTDYIIAWNWKRQ